MDWDSLILLLITVMSATAVASAFVITRDLIPSQVLWSARKTTEIVLDSQAGVVTIDTCRRQENNNNNTAVHIDTKIHHHHRVGKRRPKRKEKKKKPKTSKEEQTVSTRHNNSTTTVDTFAFSGNLPDIHWRAIPMEHLRQHPRFLPLPQTVHNIVTLNDVSLFRQDSWQWDALHAGRCTTSQAVAALGFLNELAGQALDVPRSWWRGGMGAYHRLQQPALKTVQDMQRVLLNENTNNNVVLTDSKVNNPWNTSSEHPDFDVDYQHPYHLLSTAARVQHAKQWRHAPSMVRFAWGNAQEATAILTALNYVSQNQDPGVRVREVGMCGAKLQLSLLVGATPDAVLVYSDGRIEALEVKNHCPFVVPFIKKGKTSKYSFVIRDRHLDNNRMLFAHFIPQLMMEMLCLGPACRSAVMVRQTATQGALLLRVHRDDDWIEEMLHFLSRFQSEFVDQNKPPPTNFFWNDTNKEEQSRYRRFVNRTLEIRNKVEKVAYIPHDKIQRIPEHVPLFLD